MANVRKIGNSYKITISTGYDVRGKQVRQYKTYKPDPGMTESQIKKEVQRQAVLFEESVKQGQSSKAVKFEEFAEEWFKTVAEIKLKSRTLANYNYLKRRVFRELGHIRIDKITSRNIQKFISDMSSGERHDKYKYGKLSAKTIRNHVALISGIFEHAIKMQVVSVNPCKAVTLPKDNKLEKEIYTLEEAQKILALLFQEDEKNLHFVVYFTLAIFTGFRRGELLGLEHKDFNQERQTVSVNRTSNYTNERGVFTDTPKTRTSYRTLKLPAEIMDLVNRYKQVQADYAKTLGDKWVDTDRLFTTWDGSPMFPNTPSKYLERLCKQNGLRYLSLHSLRHLNATTQIFAGIDVKTVSMNLGHSTPTTTLHFYSHAFQAAQAASMERIVEVIGIPPLRTVSPEINAENEISAK